MATAGENTMRPLLAFSTAIDLINEKIGYVCNWLVLVRVSSAPGNAMIRYAFGYSSNGWLELQWYNVRHPRPCSGASTPSNAMNMFGSRSFICFLSGARPALARYDRDAVLPDPGLPAALLPFLAVFPSSLRSQEYSGNAGGLIRWPIKFVIPAGFVMLALQGVSEVIKRIAALQGQVTIDAKYERPTQ